MVVILAKIAAVITGIAIVAPLIHDLNQGQPLGTAYANIGKGGQELVSRVASPQIRPSLVPTIGFKLDIPDWLVPR